MTLKRLEELLGGADSGPLGRMIGRARAMDDLASRLRAALDPEAAPHLVAANLRDGGEIAIVCSSPAWAARLRFESDTLVEAARAAGLDARRCTIRVARR